MKRAIILTLLALTLPVTAMAQERPMVQSQNQGPEIYFGVLAGYYNQDPAAWVLPKARQPVSGETGRHRRRRLRAEARKQRKRKGS